MKSNDASGVTNGEKTSLAVLAFVVLLILPMVSAQAMLLGAGAGLIAYTFFFRQKLRRRGWLMVFIPLTLAASAGAVVAVALHRGN